MDGPLVNSIAELFAIHLDLRGKWSAFYTKHCHACSAHYDLSSTFIMFLKAVCGTRKKQKIQNVS